MFAASPNPTNGEITIEVTEDDNSPQSGQNETISTRRSASPIAKTRKIYKIAIADFSGKKLKQFEFKSGINATVINVSDLPTGVYNVSVFDGKEWQSKKIQKQ